MERLLFFILLAVGVYSAAIPKAGVCTGPYVELLVSSVVEDGYTRRITYQWEELPQQSEIGIFDKNPENNVEPIFRATVSTANGWGNSTIDEKHVPFNELGFQKRCLSLYVAYSNDGKNWKGVNCLKTEPTWMKDLENEINGIQLKKLYIPGTHDSSAYKEYNHDHPDDLITKNSVTQDEPILAQLIYGARYIDLRVGYYPNNPNTVWWGNHGIMQFHPMSEIFGNLTEFLKNTQEIVILDVQEFPVGFGDDYEIHKKFIQLLSATFEDFIVPNSLNWESTIKQVWASGRRLIIGYDNSAMVSENNILWPAVHQSWGDKQHAEDLMEYLSNTIQNPPSSAWAAMAQLTPSASDIILNTLKGLRHAAEAVNHDVTEAFRTKEWAKNTNVLAIDFLRGSGAVNAAIQWNSGEKPCK